MASPRLMVSTLASGDIRPYVGTTDICMMPSVLDIAGLNHVSRRIISNAAGAICGMVASEPAVALDEKPAIAATMFGVTTPCVTAARHILEERGYEVLVFHATGTGGQAMEQLIEDGAFRAVLDITTTELADELVGGVMSAGPHRLEAAGRNGHSAASLPGRDRHGEFRAGGNGAGSVSRPQPVRPQPQRNPDANDPGRMCGDRTHHRHQAQPRHADL